MKADWKNTAVIIPIYNSEKYLPALFNRITKYFPIKNIFAINDASIDNSAEICRDHNVNLVDLKVNAGKGNALQIGFNNARDAGFKFAFTIDSDLQHEPEEFGKFIEKQILEESHLVIGFRSFKRKHMPFQRIMSNKLTSWVVSKASKNNILDSQCGFRLYDLKILDGMDFQTKRYQFETEVILKIAKKLGKIDFVPIETIYNDQESYISAIRDIKNFIKIVLHEMKN